MATGLKNLAITTGVAALTGYGTYRAYQHVCKWNEGASEDKIYKQLQAYPQDGLREVVNPKNIYLSAVERTNCMGLREIQGSWSKVQKCEDLKSDLLANRLKALEKKSGDIAIFPSTLERIVALQEIGSDALDQFSVSAQRAYHLAKSSQYQPDLRGNAKKALDVATGVKDLTEKTELHLGRETYDFLMIQNRSASEIADALKLSPEKKLQFVESANKAVKVVSLADD